MGIYDCDYPCAGNFFRFRKTAFRFWYQYCLSKTGSPWEEAYEVVDCSGGSISAPVSYTFEIGGSVWKLEVMPQNGWVEKAIYIVFLAVDC